MSPITRDNTSSSIMELETTAGRPPFKGVSATKSPTAGLVISCRVVESETAESDQATLSHSRLVHCFASLSFLHI